MDNRYRAPSEPRGPDSPNYVLVGKENSANNVSDNSFAQ